MHTTITKSTSTDYGIGFYERPASQLTQDPRQLSPSRKYSTQPLYRTEPFVPDTEGRLGEKATIGWQQYVGAGYRKSTTVVGKSRFELSVSLGIGVNEQYFPNSFVVSGVLKYEWW